MTILRMYKEKEIICQYTCIHEPLMCHTSTNINNNSSVYNEQRKIRIRSIYHHRPSRNTQPRREHIKQFLMCKRKA